MQMLDNFVNFILLLDFIFNALRYFLFYWVSFIKLKKKKSFHEKLYNLKSWSKTNSLTWIVSAFCLCWFLFWLSHKNCQKTGFGRILFFIHSNHLYPKTKKTWLYWRSRTEDCVQTGLIKKICMKHSANEKSINEIIHKGTSCYFSLLPKNKWNICKHKPICFCLFWTKEET